MSNPIPPLTRVLLFAVAAGYGLQLLFGNVVLAQLALWPPGTEGDAAFRPWQFVTYAFLHGDFMHLLLNAFALYMFGGTIERTLGGRAYLTYFFTCVVGAAVVHLVATMGQGAIPMVGASGGIFGLLLAFGVLYPKQIIVLLIPPIPMPAWLFVIVFGLLELYLGVTQSASPIAHFAHLGGMAVGFVLLQYWRGKLPFKPRRRLMR